MTIVCNYWRRPVSHRVGGVWCVIGQLFIAVDSPAKGDYDWRNLWHRLAGMINMHWLERR